MTAPTPSALKLLRGTARPDRANPAEPRPAVGAKPPPWLPRKGPARLAWRRLARILTATRVLTVADAEALALGCVALEEWLAARADANGWRRADAAWKRYRAVLQDFGLTPSARTRVAAVPPATVDPFEAWLAATPPSSPTPPAPAIRSARKGSAKPPIDALDAWERGLPATHQPQ